MKTVATILVVTLIVFLSLLAIGGIILMVQNVTGYDMIHTIIPYTPITNLTTLTKLTAW